MLPARMLFVVALAGCGSSGSNDGQIGGHCYPNGTCNVGLSCAGGFCVVADARPIDAPRPDAPADVAVDAFTCNNDTAFEGASRNDTVGTAYAVPDLSTQGSCAITYLSLAICPSGDHDWYGVNLTASNKTLQADIMYSTGTALQGTITNASGVPIKTLTATGTPDTLSGSATNLPSGQYYVEVFDGGGINNYRLTVTMTPCP